jgi:hypothetical protein
MPLRIRLLLPVFWLLLLASCTALQGEFAPLASLPLAAEPRVVAVEPWSFSGHAGLSIRTSHFSIYTTVKDPVYQHLLVRVLEAAGDRVSSYAPDFRLPRPLDCYIFDSRGQWERYTRDHAGPNAPLYLQISAGGYSREGVLAAYDIGRDRTLSVVAHEVFHQYSWLAFKDRLPSWLEEGLAAQNEAVEWRGLTPVFTPELNNARFDALRRALHDGRLIEFPELLSTHAGRIIRLPQSSVDAYYAQLWSLALFLERSPVYAPRLRTLLADAGAGRLTAVLAGTSVTHNEIDDFTEHWNSVAGPLYAQHYLANDLSGLERDYLAWVRQILRTGHP